MTDPRASFRLMVSAGEASGDAHAAHAVQALRALDVDVEVFGMGGAALERAGMDLEVDSRELGVIGIVDVLIHYPAFKRRLKRLQQSLALHRPDLLMIVDYPDFNLRLARTARELGIPVLFYISPQVWAWRSGRIKTIGKRVSHMAVLFPFEVEVYRQANIPVTFVGHPLVDDAHSPLSQNEAREHFGCASDVPVVTLLPGSRSGEIRRHLPVMLETAARLLERHADTRFLLPVAPSLDSAALAEQMDTLMAEQRATHGPVRGTTRRSTNESNDLPIQLIEGQACDAMRAADVVLSSSGTATLETTLIGTPMVVMYIVSRLNHALMRRLIRIDDIALVNIVAGKRIVDEFIQNAATPEALCTAMDALLSDPDRHAAQRAELAEVKRRMGEPGASQRVARLILDLLRSRSSCATAGSS